MRKIIYKVTFLILLFLYSTVLKAQLPLKQGSIVITHSPTSDFCTQLYNNTTLYTGSVVAILDASNTSAIPNNPIVAPNLPNRFVWTNSSTAQINLKPAWDHDGILNRWTESNLGRVFGITLDDIGNIYVSNTSIYGSEGSTTHHDAVWMIDGVTGGISLVWQYIYNAGGSNNTNRGLGNLKLFTSGGTRYIAVTCWEDGSIRILREPLGGPNTHNPWNDLTASLPFVPKFGQVSADLNRIPYGIAVRKGIGGSFQLFYGLLDLNNLGSTLSQNAYQIYSVSLSLPVGSFANEIAESFIPNTSNWTNPNNINEPVSDISFSSDERRIIVGQQTLISSSILSAHHSRNQEFIDNMGWNPIGGYVAGNSGYRESAAGGVSYWNNILFTDAKTACDTAILYTADFIYRTPALPPILNECTNSNFGPNIQQANVNVYGFQGLPSQNTLTSDVNIFNLSLKVDADDQFEICDKWALGDIEAFNVPLNCTTAPDCHCGRFDSLVLHNNMGVNTVYTTTWPNLTFTGVASGIISAFYHCNPSNVEGCLASYTWQVTTLAGAAVNLPASCLLNTNSFDLSCLNSVPCNNSYKITVTPKCGTVSCESKSFTVKLDCLEPLCSCAGSFSVSQSAVNVVTQNNINNNSPSSSVTTNFTLTSAFGSPSVTEVRMLVDEFRLTTTTGNDNCILCKNKPQTWASINSATLTGVLNTLFSTPPSETNMRELTFNNGGTPFTLNGNVLNLNLGVPGVTGLNCCTLKAEVCVKFIIRDINCCEREIMKCFTFNLQ